MDLVRIIRCAIFTNVLENRCMDAICYLLNIGSIRIYILMTGVVSNETNKDVRMYI